MKREGLVLVGPVPPEYVLAMKISRDRARAAIRQVESMIEQFPRGGGRAEDDAAVLDLLYMARKHFLESASSLDLAARLVNARRAKTERRETRMKGVA